MTEKKSKGNAEEQKRLYRTREDRMISGVCGGLAEYLNIDATLVRIIWVIFALFGGVGLLLYVAAIIIVPENPQETPETKEKSNDKAVFWGALLIIVGLALLLREMGFFYYVNFWDIPWQTIWAIFLIGIGLFLLYNRGMFRQNEDAEEPVDEVSDTRKKKQIYRSRTNKKLSGVCAGIANYFDLDPTLIRLGYLLLTIASVGIGVLAYIIMVIVFPEEPEENASTSIERKET